MNSVMERILAMSIQAGILIVVLLLIRKLFGRHIPARLVYALWLLPALRLVMPFTLESPLALSGLIRVDSPAAEGAFAAITPSTPAVSASPQPASPAVIDTAPAAQAAPQMPAVSAAPDIAQILFWVWLCGMALIAAYMIYVNIRFYSGIRKQREAIDGACALPVYLVKGLHSPCLCGYFRPAILVNDAALQSDDTLRLVLLHESCHYKARDQWWALIRNVCCAVHWFNPLVWWAAFVSRADAELACDARVMQGFSQEERERYGMALLSILRTDGKQPKRIRTTGSMTGS